MICLYFYQKMPVEILSLKFRNPGLTLISPTAHSLGTISSFSCLSPRESLTYIKTQHMVESKHLLLKDLCFQTFSTGDLSFRSSELNSIVWIKHVKVFIIAKYMVWQIFLTKYNLAPDFSLLWIVGNMVCNSWLSQN